MDVIGVPPTVELQPRGSAGDSEQPDPVGKPPYIRMRNLSKDFPMGHTTVRALRGVDLDINANAFTIVMGPSGSGKSTLLYVLGGLDRPTAGQIQVDGLTVNDLNENALAAYRRQRIGFIFQSFNLIPTLTALDNVAFPMRFASSKRRLRQQKAYELLEKVGLADRAYHRPTELSGGQQQRVAIARALVNDPAVILADEPTGNLDTASGDEILELLALLHRSGTTVVMVTHDVRLTRVATQIVQLLDGAVISDRPVLAGADNN